MEHCAYLLKALVSAFCSQNPRFFSQNVKNSLFVSYFSNIFVPLSLDFAFVRYPKTLWTREMAFAISFNDLEM